MRLHRLTALVLLVTGTAVHADLIRMGNGFLVQGEALKATNEGLEVKTEKETRVIPWAYLSTATRFRYDTWFRYNFKTVLAGDPATSRKTRPDAAYNPFSKEEKAASATRATQSKSIQDAAGMDGLK